MNKKEIRVWIERAVLGPLYIIPYGFLAVLGHLNSGGMRGYITAAAAMVFLAVVTGLTHHRLLAVGGLFMTTMASISISRGLSADPAAAQMKLTPVGMVIVVMALAVIAHAVIWKLIDIIKKPKEPKE